MTTQHTYRVIVRGTFQELTDGARTRLLDEVEEHGLSRMRFTPEGSLTYDRVLKHFSFRYVVVSDAADGEEMAAALAEDRAESALKALGGGAGVGFGELRSSVTDMDTMKINRKSR
ncbi:DUF6204 family protein [Streptomyces niveus]|uniref:Uncharacterized protein n=1 Tax=Streptomyces niveus TaxID=193462 RepID=A0A1U9QNU1_STRNV|nr:DUF6204 family protein [Streptomyces niveus]AQU65739.1 hypothetical protein BBN63_05260 [Streptomyces niveus]